MGPEPSSTGGIQRFKSGAHAANHAFAAMIGYVQARNILHWQRELGTWIDDLAATAAPLWSVNDRLELEDHDTARWRAILKSQHTRANGSIRSQCAISGSRCDGVPA